ncbi:hypothetical protein MMC21_003624 [Puttea exsequens]|nr:hypothetical protein [Puttea exsequens]
MKLSYQVYFLLTAVLSNTAISQPLDNPDGAATVQPDNSTADANAAAIQNKCINFTSANPNWRYHADGPWASTGTGSFGSGSKRLCFPTTASNGPGGALFIGTEQKPIGGNTKLECFFPHTGTGNCDVSVVDGYSLSVECDIPRYHKVGGSKNLFKTGKPCVDKSQLGRGICKNDKGYAPHQNDVTAFFKEGLMDSNFDCIWKNCKQDYYFPVGAEVTCHVSGGR